MSQTIVAPSPPATVTTIGAETSAWSKMIVYEPSAPVVPPDAIATSAPAESVTVIVPPPTTPLTARPSMPNSGSAGGAGG